MKKILILLLGILPLVTFMACTSEDDIRKDINDLNARLDALTDDLEKLNTDIKTFQNVARGVTLITDFSTDEKGNYTLSLSDGTTLTVYGGLPAGDIPVMGIDENGNWTYTLDGETKVLTDDEGNPCPAVPQDGADGQTPQMSIGADGYWYYTIGGETVRIEGKYNVAHIDKISASIFADVKVTDNVMEFTMPGSDEPIRVPMLGGLDMKFAPEGLVTIRQGGTISITAEQTNVAQVVIDPTPLFVSLTDEAANNLTIEVPQTLLPGDYTIYFQIFSEEGYRLVKSLVVKVESAR